MTSNAIPSKCVARKDHSRTFQFDPSERFLERLHKRRAQLVQDAVLSPTLKRMLAALQFRCGGKRFCWPALQVLANDLGYKWPRAKRTLLFQIKRLESAGLLRVQHRFRPNGSRTTSVYAIRYGALRNVVADANGQTSSSKSPKSVQPVQRAIASQPDLTSSHRSPNEVGLETPTDKSSIAAQGSQAVKLDEPAQASSTSLSRSDIEAVPETETSPSSERNGARLPISWPVGTLFREHLSGPDILELFTFAVRQNLVGADDESRLDFVTRGFHCANHANADDPGALFTWMISTGKGTVSEDARIEAQDLLEKSSGKIPNGQWPPPINKMILANHQYRRKIFQTAVSKGLLQQTQLDQVRFNALVHQSLAQESEKVASYFLACIEAGRWNVLNDDSLKRANTNLGFAFSLDELRKARMPEARCQVCDPADSDSSTS